MYSIDKNNNSICRLEEKSFASLNFEERAHLQEWIVKSPDVFGEELLIIQKEFDGFDDTRERLDLLALDKQGNLVVIENKLDDSGRDVTWQALKYASYCSSLSKRNIIDIYQKFLGINGNAAENISDFFGGIAIEDININKSLNSQRIILVAAKFRKEVTSTVLWLFNYGLRVQCFKATPYQMGEQLFVNFEQILPIKEAQEYSISVASKAQEEAKEQAVLSNYNSTRIQFWTEFIEESQKHSMMFQNHSPSKESWIGKGIGMSGLTLNLVISKNYARVEVYINRGSKEINKELFDRLESQKDDIENSCGSQLIWERKDEKVVCRIKSELSGIDTFEEDKFRAFEFMIDAAERMEKAFKSPVAKLNKMYKQHNKTE